jgi:hypothetical protein
MKSFSRQNKAFRHIATPRPAHQPSYCLPDYDTIAIGIRIYPHPHVNNSFGYCFGNFSIGILYPRQEKNNNNTANKFQPVTTTSTIACIIIALHNGRLRFEMNTGARLFPPDDNSHYLILSCAQYTPSINKMPARREVGFVIRLSAFHQNTTEFIYPEASTSFAFRDVVSHISLLPRHCRHETLHYRPYTRMPSFAELPRHTIILHRIIIHTLRHIFTPKFHFE